MQQYKSINALADDVFKDDLAFCDKVRAKTTAGKLGCILRKYRETNKVSQAIIAKHMGCHVGRIENIENGGGRCLSVEELFLFCAAMKVPVSIRLAPLVKPQKAAKPTKGRSRGYWLKRLRETNHMSLEQMSHYTKISVPRLVGFESGKVEWKEPTAKILAKCFGLTLEQARYDFKAN